LAGFQQRWLRPDNAKIFVVSNQPLSEVKAQLEDAFGKWAPPAAAKGVKVIPAAQPRPTSPRILLVDRPGAPQSTILGGQLLPVDPYSDVSPFNIGKLRTAAESRAEKDSIKIGFCR